MVLDQSISHLIHVIFDELASWYASSTVVPHDMSSDHVSTAIWQHSTTIYGPIGDVSLSVSPWTGRLRSHASPSTTDSAMSVV